MKEIKKVLICGIGAIGLIFADKISKFNNENLKILVDKKRLESYTKSPKIFNGKTLRLNYILPEDTDFKADLIIIATKFNALEEVVNNIQNFVKKDTIIISLLNGISSEEILAEKYGWENIPLAYFLGHGGALGQNKYTYDGKGHVAFGIKENYTNPEIIEIIKNYFDKAGISYKIPKDMLYAYWLKFILNVSTNQPSAILRLNFEEMLSNPKFMDLFKNIKEEVQLIAKAEGVKNVDGMDNEIYSAIKNLTPNGKTSMLQDIEAKRITEVEMFAGTIINLGKKHNIPTPYNTVMKDLIEAIQCNY